MERGTACRAAPRVAVMMNSRSPAAVAGASERVLDRGEKIELLVTRTEQLQDQSYRFSTESRRLKWSMCRDNYKLWAILVIVVIVRRFSLSLPLRCSVCFFSFVSVRCSCTCSTDSGVLSRGTDHRVAHLLVHLRLRLLQVLVKLLRTSCTLPLSSNICLLAFSNHKITSAHLLALSSNEMKPGVHAGAR